jgi:hypothetical protein
LCLS